MNIDETYNITKAAEFLGVSRPTCYKIIEKLKFKPVAHIGTMNLYSKIDLQHAKKAMNLSS